MTSLAISLLLVLCSSWAILLPFYSEKKSATYLPDPLAEAKERLLSNLEELEFDYLAKKISEEDYLKSKSELLKEASSALGK